MCTHMTAARVRSRRDAALQLNRGIANRWEAGCVSLHTYVCLRDTLPACRRCCRRDPDAWTFDDGRPHYTVSAPVPADPQLVQLLVAACTEHGGADSVVEGLDATADSFYSSQGRTGGHFEDVNEAVIEQLIAAHPQLVSLEMETFHLLDLARCSRGGIKAAAFCIAAAERYSNRWAGCCLQRQCGGRDEV